MGKRNRKWKTKMGSVLFIVGLSSLIFGIALLLQQVTDSKHLYGEVQFQKENDYQEVVEFKDYISDRLIRYLEIANKTYRDWYSIDKVYKNYITSFPGEDLQADNEYEKMIFKNLKKYYNNNKYDNTYYYYYPNDIPFSDEDLNLMYENALLYEKTDKNILYQITVNDEILYSNMDKVYKFGDTLPDGYNYAMFFDGTKVRVLKDGAEVDIYGDGIYHDECLYSVPGYVNYTTDVSLQKTTVTLLAVKTPLEYRIAGISNEGYNTGNPYYIYQDLLRLNKGWKYVLLLSVAGFISLSIAVILRHGNIDHKENLAYLLNKIWIEFKLLLLFFLIYPFIHSCMASDNFCSETMEYCYYDDAISCSITTLNNAILHLYESLIYHPLVLLLLFWIVYLFLYDIIHNVKKRQNGLLLSIFQKYDTIKTKKV